MGASYGVSIWDSCTTRLQQLESPKGKKKNSHGTFINKNPACFHSDDVNKILKGDYKVNFQMIQSESSCIVTH